MDAKTKSGTFGPKVVVGHDPPPLKGPQHPKLTFLTDREARAGAPDLTANSDIFDIDIHSRVYRHTDG